MSTSNNGDKSTFTPPATPRLQRNSVKLMQDANRQFQFHTEGLHTPSSSLTSQSVSKCSIESPSSSRMRRAVRELIHTVGDRRSKRSVYDPRGYVSVKNVRNKFTKSLSMPKEDDSNGVDEETSNLILDSNKSNKSNENSTNYGSVNVNMFNDEESKNEKSFTTRPSQFIEEIIQQISAVAVVALLNMMLAIPFGASYFPIGWKPQSEIESINDDEALMESDGIDGPFPLPNKQNLGLRMLMLSTIIAQLVYTYKSKFVNAVGLQMVENIPFMHALAGIVIRRQGYGPEALSTLFFLFGFSSVIVGLVFYALGKLKLGKIVYFFPNHVLVGAIGGIGVFIVFTAMEVATNTTFDIMKLSTSIQNTIINRWYLLWVVFAFEITLRVLMYITKDPLTGRPKFQLLSPIFYVLITPIFYIGMFIFGMSIEDGRNVGYFFPAVVQDSASGEVSSGGGFWNLFDDPHLWDIFHIIDFRTISWMAVAESTGTVIALAAFSLIHVPINIPAFAISTDVDTDMNAELIAHGWSNCLSGLVGGLQNYMTYSNSVLYAKTGGKGRISSLAIVLVTVVLFVIGPSITDFLPRCMAGTLLLHMGIDLTLEGVYDSIGQYDNFEYFGILLIAVIMTVWGMTAALIAGVITALSTYAAQSINYHDPIRQVLTATSLRSSAWTRCAEADSILKNSATGRARILIFQLQGHLFFGNVALMTDTIKDILKEKTEEGDPPIVVIIDFTLVIGMDSSAAHSVAKLKKILHRLYNVELSIFCTGKDRGGFPCEFALSEALSEAQSSSQSQSKNQASSNEREDEEDGHKEMGWSDFQVMIPPGVDIRGSVSFSNKTVARKASQMMASQMSGRVCETLDDALQFAEDILICRQDCGHKFHSFVCLLDDSSDHLNKEDELDRAKAYLRNMMMDDSPVDFQKSSAEIIVSMMVREEYNKSDIVWDQGASGTSLKVLVTGELLSLVDETGASEIVKVGSIVGELGLVHNTPRLTTLACSSSTAVLYSLDIESWKKLKDDHPKVASLIYGIAIRYLAHRVQHVSNRYFHTTLPV